MEEEKRQGGVVNHFEKDSNCQVFNGNVTGCVFAMPGSTVTQQPFQPTAGASAEKPVVNQKQERNEQLCLFIHPSVGSDQEWVIHDEVKRLVTRQRMQDICQYLLQLKKENKLLLPQAPSSAYEELVRMGMPNGEGFNETTFRKYYRHK